MLKRIEKESPLPHYAQLKNILYRQIIVGDFSDKLPGEHHLANEYKVSYMTVRRAVGELIDEGVLYRENGQGTFVARPGRRGTVYSTVLFSLSNITTQDFLEPFYSEILSGVITAAAEKNYTVITSYKDININHDNSDIRGKKIKYDGIISPVPHDLSAFKILNQFLPVVLIGDWQLKKELPAVFVNSYKGAMSGLNYLFESGHKRIGLLVHNSEVTKNISRYKAYCDFLKIKAIPFDNQLIYSTEEIFSEAEKAGDYFLDMEKPPTAIFCHNDIMAAGVLKTMHKRNIKVPENISILGYNDTTIAIQVFPELSTVRAGTVEIGKQAFNTLYQMIEGEIPSNAKQQVEIESKLIIRGTTGFLS